MADITQSVPVLSAPMVTINGYVYSDASYSFGMIWWMLTVMMPRFPRMMRNGVSYWREHGRAPYLLEGAHHRFGEIGIAHEQEALAL